jgi:hypothetical protein
MIAISNNPLGYKKREQLAAAPKKKQAKAVLTKEEVVRRIASNPSGYMAWPLPALSKKNK